MHIAIAFDSNYLVPFYALVTSIFYNNPNQAITVHCIIRGISELEKQKIVKYINNHNSSIYFYVIDEELIANFVVRSQWTTAVYYKIFFPLIVPDTLERLLYLDTDTLVLNNLNTLYNTDFHHYPLAAVYDNYVKIQPDLGIYEEGCYFNSGVMLFNLKEWKKQHMSEKALDILSNHPEKITYVDQDALNAVLINNWLRIPEKFNLLYSYIPQDLPKSLFKDFLKDKVVIHFTLHRPWSCLCQNRFRYLYKKYLRLSPKRDTQVIQDFSLKKTRLFVHLRIVEFYIDNQWLRSAWKMIKSLSFAQRNTFTL